MTNNKNEKKILKACCSVLSCMTFFSVAGCGDAPMNNEKDKIPTSVIEKQISQVVGKKNIIYIFTDEQRTDSIGAYGSSWAHTPNIDRLANEGTLFSNFYSNSPVCVPSRMAFMTGLYPCQTGVVENSAAKSVAQGGYNWVEGGEVKAYTEILKQNGYKTACKGKIHLPVSYSYDNIYDEWEEPKLTDANKPYSDVIGNNVQNVLSPYTDEMLDVIRIPRPNNKLMIAGLWPDEPQKQTLTAYTGDQTVNYINEWAKNKDNNEPFILYSSFIAPHTPVITSQEYYDLYDNVDIGFDEESTTNAVMANQPEFFRRYLPGENVGDYNANKEDIKQARLAYYALVSEVDAQVGKIIRALEDNGIYDDTIIVYTSDHGNMIGEFNRFQKSAIYDYVVRVPLIIKGPGIPMGVVDDNMYESVDLAPTLLSKVGVEVPSNMHGVDMFNPTQRKDFIIGNVAITKSVNDPSLKLRNYIITKEYMLDYTSYLNDEKTDESNYDGKLVDRINDPLEHKNLFNNQNYKTIRDELIKKLENKMRSMKENVF